MHSLEIREKWDKNIKKSIMIKKINRLSIIYILNKNAGIGFQKRDFYEKKVSFKISSQHGAHGQEVSEGEGNSKYYYYFSSLDNAVLILGFTQLTHYSNFHQKTM
jgi:hypothetical protein